ncbi:hypothetical protein C7M71_002315 [Peterkaempfera bronchialis]|uniref:Uncharacterized protein n=1 Tax=Peterkaempfera bronchialis TaxID=2126346 RepID=A0A345SRX3_9ACTN|nr:hypothetical protein C7M71_002315 [Peterkaempfera bronchialis]
MCEGKLDALSQMMAEHMSLPFPPGVRGLDKRRSHQAGTTRWTLLRGPNGLDPGSTSRTRRQSK